MSLNRQTHIYSVDTKSFYNEKEEKLNKKLTWNRIKVNLIKEYILYSMINNKKYIFENVCDYYKQKTKSRNNKYIKRYINQLKKNNRHLLKSKEFKQLLKENSMYLNCKKNINQINKKLNDLLKSNVDIRELNPKKVSKYNIVSLFESYLSRTLQHRINELTEDLIIVRILHYSVLDQLIEKGFFYNKEKYITFTSSAGQIRNKKIVFIKESIWNQYYKTIMCGLSIKDINNSKENGCNINKFLAYLALCNSATDKWEEFDIDKAIVINDFETKIFGEVDYIDNKTFEVERKEMEISVEHSDGCGWILLSESNKNFMTRLPWLKGLLTPVNYLSWIEKYNNGNYKVTDIYGKEWDLKQDDIRYVFSKSQFKMWKYYHNELDEDGNVIKYGWDKYKGCFKKYNCHASKCNIEPDTKDFTKANFNYQMWQTLIDITDEEIEMFTDKVEEFITRSYTDRDTMLKILGATDSNVNKNNLQKALQVYPELLNDYHVKKELSDAISSKKKDAKFAKFKIDATYTFLLPDIVAWMEYVFQNNKNPKGILNDGEVSCKLYRKKKELLVNRSPHLYREHAVRKNIINKETKEWFITDGAYTSCHDLISKILQFDNDGDKALVVAEDTLILIAKRNMVDIVPLYYQMGKASAKEINPKNIYESLITAFKYGNIGEFSNKLTKLWNNKELSKNLKLHKIITALNNFSIDAAKTLEMPKIPKEIELELNKVNKIKLPYFFKFAKDNENVDKINDSTVNRICKKIENIQQNKFDFKNVGRFRSSNLMKNSKIEIDIDVINEYKRLNKDMQKYFFKNDNMTKQEIACAVWDTMKKEFGEFCKIKNISYINAVDMILKYIYKTNRSCKKELLFNVFGDVIIENLKNNIKDQLSDGYIQCEKCGKRVKKTGRTHIYCGDCFKENRRIYKAAKERERRNKQKSVDTL